MSIEGLFFFPNSAFLFLNFLFLIYISIEELFVFLSFSFLLLNCVYFQQHQLFLCRHEPTTYLYLYSDNLMNFYFLKNKFNLNILVIYLKFLQQLSNIKNGGILVIPFKKLIWIKIQLINSRKESILLYTIKSYNSGGYKSKSMIFLCKQYITNLSIFFNDFLVCSFIFYLED